MIRKAFRMSVNPGAEAEYERRHRPIWEDLEAALLAHGRGDVLDLSRPRHPRLFGYVEIEDEDRWEGIAGTDVCQRWWRHMSDIMPPTPTRAPPPATCGRCFHIER